MTSQDEEIRETARSRPMDLSGQSKEAIGMWKNPVELLKEKHSFQEEEAETVDLSVHRSGIVPTLQNIVATVNLGCLLDLKNIALHARNAEYNPKVL